MMLFHDIMKEEEGPIPLHHVYVVVVLKPDTGVFLHAFVTKPFSNFIMPSLEINQWEEEKDGSESGFPSPHTWTSTHDAFVLLTLLSHKPPLNR